MRLEVLAATFGVTFAAFAAGAYLMSAHRRKRTDALIETLLAGLPSWDCGLCGEKTCAAYAKSLISAPADRRCVPGGELVENRLTVLLGRNPYKTVSGSSVAIVACAGSQDVVRPSYAYTGYRDCAAAAKLYGGPRACGTGCLGYGTCIPACPQGAITVSRGLAVIHQESCDGCGSCVSACPTGVLRVLPRRDAWYVACSSTASAKVKTESCSASCTGCGACERRSAGSEFSIRNNLAVPSATVTGNWAAIADDCPTGVIRSLQREKRQ